MKKIILLLFILMLSGCTNKPTTNLSQAKKGMLISTTSLRLETIEIIETGKGMLPEGCKYLGSITVDAGWQNDNAINDKLRTKAALLGGDTVIIPIKNEVQTFGFMRRKVNAIVARCHPQEQNE